jgi:hypothetical protein
MELKLAPEELADAVAGAVERALREAGVAAAVRAAIDAELALRGLLTKEQGAKYLGIESRTLEIWMRPAGQNGGRGVPHLKIGETVRFKLASLEAWALQFEVNKVLPAAA